ncbi:MAG: preprotein translocase subunit SecG [Lachnospiraceae bacterium]|nr:preprotein translocase subunit SecG [Lachnospiraceae bacterium]
MKTALTIAFIILCIILIVLVLCQEAKDNGLGTLAGSPAGETYWSKNKGRDKKVVATAIGVVFFLALALLISSKWMN